MKPNVYVLHFYYLVVKTKKVWSLYNFIFEVTLIADQ